MTNQMQIGEVAATTRLSLRTIRQYEEVGRVVPSAAPKEGFACSAVRTSPACARCGQ